MVTVRYKKPKFGKFSAYLDIYTKNGDGKGKRNYEYLRIRIDKDHSEKVVRITEADKDKLKISQSIRSSSRILIIPSLCMNYKGCLCSIITQFG